jgi:hypothetical protein
VKTIRLFIIEQTSVQYRSFPSTGLPDKIDDEELLALAATALPGMSLCEQTTDPFGTDNSSRNLLDFFQNRDRNWNPNRSGAEEKIYGAQPRL